MLNLSQKTIIITGASSGLGKAIALRLAKENTRLALVARGRTELEQVAAQASQLGSEARVFPLDLQETEQINPQAQEIMTQFGGVDILINNAGIWKPGGLAQHSLEDIKALFDTNVLGTTLMTQAVLPHMEERNSGQILNVMSIAAVEEIPDYGLIYTATKHALQGFTDTLKKSALKSGVKVMGFFPGGMDTNIMRAATGQEVADKSQLMNVADVAEVIHFMLAQSSDVILDHVEMRKFIGQG